MRVDGGKTQLYVLLTETFVCRFMRLFEKIFSAHSFVMVGCASLVMVVCLFVLVQHFWAVGLFMIGMVLVQILFICVMGTVFETSCERFGLKLYLINWHLLSPKHRQHLRLVMQMAQTPPLNTMGGVLPSNLNSFMLVRITYGQVGGGGHQVHKFNLLSRSSSRCIRSS